MRLNGVEMEDPGAVRVRHGSIHQDIPQVPFQVLA